MAYRSSSANHGVGGAISTPVPAGVQADDIVLLVVSVDDTSADFTTLFPAGFTMLKQDQPALDGQKVALGWKRLTGADSGSYTFGGSNSAQWACSAYAFSGRDTGNPPVCSASNVNSAGISSGGNVSANGVSALAGDDLAWIVGFDVGAGTLSSHTLNAPGTYTIRQDDANPDWSWTGGASKDNVGAGATGTVTGTATFAGPSSVGYAAYLVRIPAAAGGGGGTHPNRNYIWEP